MTPEEQERECEDLEERLLEMESRFRSAFVQLLQHPTPANRNEIYRIRSELDAGWAEYHELIGYPRPVDEGDRDLRDLLSDLEWDLARFGGSAAS